MKTRKPIATISFNTKPFLLGKLKELVEGGILEYWQVIEHEPEPDEVSDEAGHKKHWHVYMEPARQIQTTDLRTMFQEPDPTNVKPLGCLQIVSSKFADWYLYGLHDPAYLMSKKQSRVYTYEPEQMIASDDGDMQQKVASIDRGASNTYLTIREYQLAGRDFAEYMVGECIAVRDVPAHKKAWDEMLLHELNRNGRSGHVNSYAAELSEEAELPEPPRPARLPQINEVDFLKHMSVDKQLQE